MQRLQSKSHPQWRHGVALGLMAWTGWTLGWLLGVSVTVPYDGVPDGLSWASRVFLALGAAYWTLQSRKRALGSIGDCARGLGLGVLNLWGSVLSLAIAQGGLANISPLWMPLVIGLFALLYGSAIGLMVSPQRINLWMRGLGVAISLVLLTLVPVFFEALS